MRNLLYILDLIFWVFAIGFVLAVGSWFSIIVLLMASFFVLRDLIEWEPS